MTLVQLSNYFYINKQIEQLKERISQLETTLLGATKMSGMPHGTSISDPVQQAVESKMQLQENLNKKLQLLYIEEKAIENFINDISDIKIQTIIRMRFIQLKSWDNIATELNYDRTTPYKLIKNYINEYNKLTI